MQDQRKADSTRAAWARLGPVVSMVSVLVACTPISSPRDGQSGKAGAGAVDPSGAGSGAGSAPGLERARPGDSCSPEGARACAADSKRIPLRCEDATWHLQEPCDSNQRCEAASGAEQGQCVAIAIECIGRDSGARFCGGSSILTCVDQKPTTVLSCAARQRCTQLMDAVSCTCVPGSVDTGSGCNIPTDCTVANGGCDTATQCDVVNGARVCSACPPGFVGDGKQGCLPLLSELSLTGADLVPVFTPDVHSYQVKLPLLRQHLTLKAQSAEQVRIDVNNRPLSADGRWSSPTLALGEQTLRITLTSPFSISSQYDIQVTRTGIEEAFVKASQPGAQDTFGYGLAIHEDTLVVGAIYEDSSSAEIDGNQADDNARDSGAVYVFVRDAKGWSQQAYLKSDAPEPNAFFGANVAVWGDTIAVGAPRGSWIASTDTSRSGQVHIFVRNAGKWTRQKKLIATQSTSGDLFGFGLALQNDRLLVGAPHDLDGAPQSGAVYAFFRAGDTWSEPVKLKASPVEARADFGWSIALDGDTFVTGAHHDKETGTISDVPGAGYVFGFDGAAWKQRQTFRAPNPMPGDRFGYRVALHGERAAFGAPRCDILTDTPPGEVHVFQRSGGSFAPTASIKAPVPRSTDCFGAGLALVGDSLVIGSMGDSSAGKGVGADPSADGVPASGAAFVFDLQPEGWIRSATLKASNAKRESFFGEHVAGWGDRVVVGSTGESGGVGGVNANQERSATGSGAAYVFE